MKHLIYLLLGAIVGYLIWGFITNDFSSSGFSMIMIGLIIGFFSGRRTGREEAVYEDIH